VESKHLELRVPLHYVADSSEYNAATGESFEININLHFQKLQTDIKITSFKPFAKLRKVTISSITVCLPVLVCPHETTRLPTNRIRSKIILEHFRKSFGKIKV
jgi:hypothetical protein